MVKWISILAQPFHTTSKPKSNQQYAKISSKETEIKVRKTRPRTPVRHIPTINIMGDLGSPGKTLYPSSDIDVMEGSVSCSTSSATLSSSGDWRTDSKGLRSKLEYALSSGILSDLTCVVGTGSTKESISCHSLILRLQSSAFDNKFAGSNTVELPKYEPKIFRQFLLFLYTEKFNPTVEEAISLLYVAKGFEVTNLVERCSKLLKTEINVENASVFYMKANEYEETQLEDHAKSFILKNAEAVFDTAGFLRLTNFCLRSLLESPGKAINEVATFQAMMRWASAECDRESLEHTGENFQYVLKACTDLINYDAFTPEEFSEHVVDTEILPAAASLQILKRLNLERIKLPTPAQEPPSRLSRSLSRSRSRSKSATRSSFRLPDSEHQVFTLERFKAVTEGSWSGGGTEKISVRCSKSVELMGLGLYGRSIGTESKIKTCIIVSNFDENAQLATCNKMCTVPEGGGIFTLNLEYPVMLVEHVWYTISINMEGEMYPYGTGGKKKYEGVQFGTEKLTFEFKNPKGVAGASTGRGQIPQLLFKV